MLVQLIQKHQRSKKNFAIQDAYKLIYQSVFGIRHILDNSELAKQYLEQEFEAVNAEKSEKIIENISVSGEIVRLNLRPYKYRNGDVDRLFQAMLRSAEFIAGSKEKFLSLWSEFKNAVLNGELTFDKDELKIFDANANIEDYPAIHHSSSYREANQPAYRILSRELAERLMASQNICY